MAKPGARTTYRYSREFKATDQSFPQVHLSGTGDHHAREQD